MPGCVPDCLVVIIDAIDGAAFDFRPLGIFAPGSLPDDKLLGRDEPGSVIEVAPTTETVVGGRIDVNGFVGGGDNSDCNWFDGICVSCNSVLLSGASSSMVRGAVKICPRIGPDSTAGI